MEINPRLINNLEPLNEKRIILGSFPPWHLTPSKNDKEKREKVEIIEHNRDGNFYFGTSHNLFWDWYKEKMDSTIEKQNISTIKKSLKNKSIGITDLIIKCERVGRSALDKNLKKREYHHVFFITPKKGEVLKILCTSKGLMNEMLLNKQFFKTYKSAKINFSKSQKFQSKLVSQLSGNLDLISSPIFLQVDFENGGEVHCLSIPSPGSPFRKLSQFGFESNNRNEYLNNYLELSFKWFKR